MRKELKLTVIALCFPFVAFAQKTTTEQPATPTDGDDDTAFTFTEAQLTDDDNTLNTISIVGSNNNVYAREVGYRFSAARFKYRALGGKYNEMYINGNPVNDVERGEFNFSYVGGLNNQTRNAEHTLPFEDNNYAMTALAGSNNYNFRPTSMPAGQRVSLSGANRNYTLRGMYSYNSGITKSGWALSGALTYRWANMETANIKGTFYNALSYYLGVEKMINPQHSVSFVTWGNPTERAAQSASTDEMYWLANSNYYNPNWGYQDGKKRSSRIVNSYAPSALLTWDWKISEETKLVTSLLGKYSMYSSTRLNYNNSTNPAPDYYSSMPSSFFNVYGTPAQWGLPEDQGLANWQSARDYFMASEANRQINWDRLYEANRGANAKGLDAMYYLQAYHDDQLAFSLASNLHHRLNKSSVINVGIQLSTNKGMHYQTLEDKLGAEKFSNINTYVAGKYGEDSNGAKYDLTDTRTNLNAGDRFGYDYNIFVNKATLWASYALDWRFAHIFVSGRGTGTTIQREGKMQNGLAPDNSLGDSRKAKFFDGGGKIGAHLNLGNGHTVVLGGTYELKAPAARHAFYAPQVNNDFVHDLKLEKVMGAELGYQLQTSWMQANLNGYYARINDVTEYSMAYNDIQHSFSYISLTGINKEYYGVELGINFKVTDDFSIKTLGTISEAKYANNANVVYMLSENGKDYTSDICVNKGMREGGTPLAAASVDLSYRINGWFIDVIGNYFDKIYLYYSPITRYYNDLPQLKDENGKIVKDTEGHPMHDISKAPEQAKGKGGFMLDINIGKSIYLKKGRSLAFNLMLTNVLNNTKICTGGMEQNRRSTDENGEDTKTYKFDMNPKKFYANGINGMLNITYKF